MTCFDGKLASLWGEMDSGVGLILAEVGTLGHRDAETLRRRHVERGYLGGSALGLSTFRLHAKRSG